MITLFLGCLTLEGGINMSTINAGNKLPSKATQQRRIAMT
jgi:hypothetical protein